ncbi:MAG: Superoxide dismutase [Gammaproteobacteria bacterium]|nr:Superoxide dismutase [Gammaproteobacteria bacterium]
MNKYSRRDVIQTAAAIAAAPIVISTLASGTALAQQATAVFAPQHTPKPLPYAAGALQGLSERMIQSHWENNYGGSVRALNLVKQRLAEAMAVSDFPAIIYNDMKREHLIRTGSVVLHELYFENLGGSGPASAAVREKLSGTFGSYDAWEAEYRRIGAGLGGGSGWVMLALNRHSGLLENYWLADHAHSTPHATPILVMDMYEHSYQMDYGAAAARYIDAFFANINWDIVSRRLESAVA